MVVPVLYNNGNRITDFVDCTIKIRHDASENNETPLIIKPESVLCPFSEHATIPLESRQTFFKKIINMLLIW